MPRNASGLLSGFLVTGLLLTSACSGPFHKDTEADKLTPPKLGACRVVTPADIDKPSNTSDIVACTAPHTAQTFAIGTLPTSTGSAYDDSRHGKWIYPTCEKAFEKFIGVDESQALRVQLSWAWFRASAEGWKKGARWYRCDLVGGPSGATKFADLPATGRGLFSARPPEKWLTCAQGQAVLHSVKVACTEKHDWRAVTTIKLGGPEDSYPGDRLVEVRTRDFCSASVEAWMNYPPAFDFGYTYFHQAEWDAGNRRSVCWAKTSA